MKTHLTKFATVAALAAGMAFAQTPAPSTPAQTAPKAIRGRAGIRHRMMQALNLTPDQKQQAKSIFQQNRQQMAPVLQQAKQNREALSAAIKANDTGQIQQLSTQQGNLQGQVVAMRSASMAKFYATLTPDQRAKADQIQQRIKARRAAPKG